MNWNIWWLSPFQPCLCTTCIDRWAPAPSPVWAERLRPEPRPSWAQAGAAPVLPSGPVPLAPAWCQGLFLDTWLSSFWQISGLSFKKNFSLFVQKGKFWPENWVFCSKLPKTSGFLSFWAPKILEFSGIFSWVWVFSALNFRANG